MYTETIPRSSTFENHDPAFRKINFDDSPAVSTVSKHLRHAWNTLPAAASTAGHAIDLPRAISDFIAADYSRSEEQRDALPKHPNKEAVRTEWRTAVAEFWNHVFCDVCHYLREKDCNVGCFHASKPNLIVLNYPKPGEEFSACQKVVFPENRLIIPAFFDSGASIQAFIQEKQPVFGGYEVPRQCEIGSLDDRNFTEAWYVRRNREATFCVESDQEMDRSGVAAVLVCGLLCSSCNEHSSNGGIQPERMEEVLLGDGLAAAEEAIDEGYGEEIFPLEENQSQPIDRNAAVLIGGGITEWSEKDKWRPVYF